MDQLNPTYWKALNSFCMRVGADDPVNQTPSTVRPLTEEDRKFLTDALTEFARNADPVVRLKCELDILKTLDLVDPKIESEIQRIVLSLQNIEEFVCDIDMGQNLIKVNGMPIVMPALTSTNASVRTAAYGIVGQMAQNNPQCQQFLVEAGLVPALLAAVEHDADQECKAKALFAMSAVCRSSAEGHAAFVSSDGHSVLLRLFTDESATNDRILTKILFLMCALAREHPEDADTLLSMGCLQRTFLLLEERCVTDFAASGVLCEPMDQQWREHALQLCTVLVERAKNDPDKQDFWKSDVLEAKWRSEDMKKFLQSVAEKSDSEKVLMEERETAKALLKTVFDQ